MPHTTTERGEKCKNLEVYFPWLGKKGNWKEYLYGEIHLLVARVQGEDSLDAQISHGDDFVHRITELVEAVIKHHEQGK